MAFLEMAGLLFCVKGFHYHCQILLVVSVLDNVQDEFDVQVTVHRDKLTFR